MNRSQVVRLPELPGSWSLWDKASWPGSWFLVPASVDARESGFIYAVARFRTTAGLDIVRLLATSPDGRIKLPGQYREADFELRTGKPTRETGRPQDVVLFRSGPCRRELPTTSFEQTHDDCRIVTPWPGGRQVCNCSCHSDRQVSSALALRKVNAPRAGAS